MAENAPQLGQLCPADARRDAIHVAVAPVVAGVDLEPGQHVGLFPDGTAKPTKPHIGIVDPFLTERVSRGQTFWLCLYQNTVTGLRHAWTHPAFPGTVSVSDDMQEISKAWIEIFAKSVGLDYDDLMGGAADWLSHEQYLNRGDLLEGEYVPDEFWLHYEAITGQRVPEQCRQNFFTCSC